MLALDIPASGSPVVPFAPKLVIGLFLLLVPVAIFCLLMVMRSRARRQESQTSPDMQRKNRDSSTT